MNTSAREVGALTPEVEWSIANELARVEHGFDTGEVLGVPAKCLVGFEVEYKLLDPLELIDDQQVEERFGYSRAQIEEKRAQIEPTRALITQDLSLLTPQNEQEAARQQAWLGQVETLELKDLVNYQIYRRLATPALDTRLDIDACLKADNSPETSIEYRFGTDLYQVGYYDNPSVYEARTAAATPTIAVERHRRFVETTTQLANEYGLIFDYMGDHTNFSVWTEKDGELEPMHSLATPEDAKLTSAAAGGMLRALTDAEIAFTDLSFKDMAALDALEDMTASNLKLASLRVLDDRFEYRRTIGRNGQHDLAVLAMMSGFTFGVKDPEMVAKYTSTGERPEIVPAEGFDKEQDLHLLRALQFATYVDGHFEMDEQYLRSRGNEVFRSMVNIDHPSQKVPPGYITSLFKTISIGEDGALTYDAERFKRLLSLYAGSSTEERDNPRIAESIHTIRSEGTINTVQGAVSELRVTTWGSVEQKVAQIAMTAALREVIDWDLLNAIHDAQAPSFVYGAVIKDWLTVTDAIARGKLADNTPETILQKIADIQALHQEASGEDVLAIIRDKTDMRIGALRRDLEKYGDPTGMTVRELHALESLLKVQSAPTWLASRTDRSE